MRHKQNEAMNQAIDLLINNDTDISTLLKEDGLLKQLTKRLVEKALQSEMNNHLGYDKYCHTDSDNVRNGRNVKNLVTNNGVVEIEVPRDRSSTFEPALIPKRQRRIEGFDDKIISLYAKGMSLSDIKIQMQELYGADVSESLISQITDDVIEDVKIWQSRPLEALDFMVSGFKSKSKQQDTGQEDLIKSLFEQIGQLTVERDWLKKNLVSLDLEVRKKMISYASNLTIARQCELLDLNRSSYYYRARNTLDDKEYRVLNRIDEIFTEHPYYGTRRMSHVLKPEGLNVSRKMIRKYYKILGIEAVYPKLNLSRRNQAHKVYPYLLNNIEVVCSNQVYCADITYIRLKQGFVYLVAIMDWYSRYILSWRVSISLENDFCIEALNEAISIHGNPDIFNTDQGVQFTSKDFTQILEQQGIAISMDGKGRALDNVFIERFWRSLKQEKMETPLKLDFY